MYIWVVNAMKLKWLQIKIGHVTKTGKTMSKNANNFISSRP